MANASVCYGLYDKNKIIGFIGILHFPHPINKKIKRVTRLVILPDYQGIGLGTLFLERIATIYKEKGFEFRIITTAKNLIQSLYKNKKWILSRYSKNKKNGNGKASLNKTVRFSVKTASFLYK